MDRGRTGAAGAVIIVGGGAAGIFAAIRAAELAPRLRVTVLEKGRLALRKVGISGGGRCNLTHDCRDPRELVKHYPRGGRQLRGMFSRFAVQDTIDWFAARNVALKTEADGRMFPATDQSATVTDCLLGAARAANVEICTRQAVVAARPAAAGGFMVDCAGGQTFGADRLLIASGGMRVALPGGGGGRELAASLGHTIEAPVPSLFSLQSDDARLRGLAGLGVAAAEVQVAGVKELRSRGSLLITHRGLSGPAVLALSAWGARRLADCGHACDLFVDWLPAATPAQIAELFASLRAAQPRRRIMNTAPAELPRRLWERLATAAGIPAQRTWSELRREEARALGEQLKACRLSVAGKTLNKEEFVTCGGVALGEVDLRRMESRLVPGLFFAGEVLDIDGVTGGFNLQAAWTSGWIAGEGLAALFVNRTTSLTTDS